MQCPKCHYEPTLSEMQASPDDCVKCGINYKGHARYLEEEEARRSAERKAQRQVLMMAPAARDVHVRYPGAQPVVVIDVRMSFWSMVVFMVKWVIAAIPAFIILSLLASVVFAVFTAIPSYFGYAERARAERTLLEGERIPVPLDVKEKFFVVSVKRTGALAKITVKSELPDGVVVYSRMAVDCRQAVAAIVSTGSTLESMGADSRNETFERVQNDTPRKFIAARACIGSPEIDPILL